MLADALTSSRKSTACNNMSKSKRDIQMWISLFLRTTKDIVNASCGSRSDCCMCLWATLGHSPFCSGISGLASTGANHTLQVSKCWDMPHIYQQAKLVATERSALTSSRKSTHAIICQKFKRDIQMRISLFDEILIKKARISPCLLWLLCYCRFCNAFLWRCWRINFSMDINSPITIKL